MTDRSSTPPDPPSDPVATPASIEEQKAAWRCVLIDELTELGASREEVVGSVAWAERWSAEFNRRLEAAVMPSTNIARMWLVADLLIASYGPTIDGDPPIRRYPLGAPTLRSIFYARTALLRTFEPAERAAYAELLKTEPDFKRAEQLLMATTG